MTLPHADLERRFEGISDEEIVERVRAGETHLYEGVIRRYNQRLYRIARAIVQDEGEAEDVMQEAYLRAFEHLAEFAGRARFSTWLSKIAVYEALARRRRRNRLEGLGDLDEEDMPKDHRIRDPEDQASGSELRAVLEEAIDGLVPTQRAVFVLREIEGLSTAEAAECLELSEEAVKVRLHRARAALRTGIEQRLGWAVKEAFSFGLSRCDGLTARVLERIRAMVSGERLS